MDDEVLSRLLAQWNVMSPSEIAAARELQRRLQIAGDKHPLEALLVDFKFLEHKQLTDTIEAAEAILNADEGIPDRFTQQIEHRGEKFGHYVFINEIGRGGLGVVYRAFNTETRQIVALKLLETDDEQRAKELMQEGSQLARLRHENIIPLYEFGQIRGRYYLSMKLLEGVGLEQLIRSARLKGKMSPFYTDPNRYLSIVRDIARALHYMHTRTPPLIHCDLKPHNVFVDLNQQAYLVDFGLSQDFSPGKNTEEFSGRGTPAYMAPEQLLETNEKADVRTDVYGIGAILYELLCGRPPFTGDVKEVLSQNLVMDPPAPSKVVTTATSISSKNVDLPTVPPAVEVICLRCLRKEKSERYGSAEEVANELDKLVNERSLQVRHTKVRKKPETPGPTTRRRIAKIQFKKAMLTGFVSGIVLVVVAAVVGFFLMMGDDTSELDLQRKSLVSRMDSLVAGFRIEEAEGGFRAFAELAGDKFTNEWVNHKLEELLWIKQFRENLAVLIDRRRPLLEGLKLRGGETWDAQVLRASRVDLLVTHPKGERSVHLGQLDPKRLLELVKEWQVEFVGKLRLGVALYAMKNHMWHQARAFLKTSDCEEAKEYLTSLPPTLD